MSKYRILYADDHEANRLLIKTFLLKADCDVDLVVDGEEAVQAEAEHDYDLIILDISMPKKTGLEAARVIRQREKESGESAIPIVTLTALSDNEIREACKLAGIDRFLTKPATRTMLLDSLREFLPDL